MYILSIYIFSVKKHRIQNQVLLLTLLQISVTGSWAFGPAYSGGGDIWGKLWFLCEMAPCGGALVSTFRHFSASVGEFWLWAGHWVIIPWGLEIFLIFPNLLRSLFS